MKVILREDESGVSEVIGTILILAMTVVLFSVIIIWVSNIPTPAAQSRLDVQSQLDPIYNVLGQEIGVNITLLHTGGEALQYAPTIIYLSDQQGSSSPTTISLRLRLYTGTPLIKHGLLDGSDLVWDLGERWRYTDTVPSPGPGSIRSSDQVTVTIVDIQKSIIVWSGQMNTAAGTRPPIFQSIWADGIPSTDAIDPVQAGLGFVLYAKVGSPDNDLNRNSVYATWYVPGVGVCSSPFQMRDDGVSPDKVAGDGVFTLGANPCMMAPLYPLLSWSGTFILLNATDTAKPIAHSTTTRFVLNVVPQTGVGSGGGGTIPSQLWQYIGYVQIRTGEVWVSNLNNPYTTTTTFQPYRINLTSLTGDGGTLFHLKMANHGNTTIFVDGWTGALFSNTQSASGTGLFIVAPCDPNKPALSSLGTIAYPGGGQPLTDFQYAYSGNPAVLSAGCASGVPPSVFDINPVNQETGGTPYVVLLAASTQFSVTYSTGFHKGISYFMNILISGMAGPTNYTYQMLLGNGANPRGCSGLGAAYNPYIHLNDPIAACRSSWYAQVIPFIGMTVY